MLKQLLLLFVASLFCQCFCQLPIDDLITGEACGGLSQVDGGLVVSHQPINRLPPPISNNITCFFTMQSIKFRQKVRFVFSHFALTPTDCSISFLKFYDGRDNTADLLDTICPLDDVVGREFTSTSFELTLELRVTYTDANPPTANFTGYYVGYTDDRDPCVEPDIEFMCGNGRCIYKTLECDTYDSCGDGTDEGTGPPTNCNFTTTTPGTTTTSASTTSTTPDPTTTTPTTPTTTVTIATTTASSTADDSVNLVIIDLTPLYIILTLTFALFVSYLVYSLLSIQCFKAGMTSCLHHCCLTAIRRRRIWKENVEEKSNGRLRRKITPENRNTSMIIENLSTCDLQRNGKVAMDGKESVYATAASANGNSLADKNTISESLIRNA